MNCFIATLSLALLAQSNAQKTIPGDLRCGSYCLYLGMKSLNVPIENHAMLEKELGQPSPLGYSMEQLAESARNHGLNAEGFVTSVENLARRPGRFACIALLDRGHFVNIYDIEGGKLFLIDPPSKQVVATDAFKAMWSGKVLLISDQPLLSDDALIPWYQRRAIFVGFTACLILIGLLVGGFRAYNARS